MSEWWQEFFGGLWREVQLDLWTEEDNLATADKIERVLDLSAHATIRTPFPVGASRMWMVATK